VRATDTTGAGDAFCGAFMSRWLASVPASPGWASASLAPGADPAVADRTVADLTAAAEFAVRVAATVVTRFGARPV
jgi:sugar/nucleoside kinase (ribokinase family)